MIFHSIIPLDIVFKGFDSLNTAVENSSRELITMDYLGERIEAYRMSNNQIVVNRILSTSPKAFLHPKLQPGCIVDSTFSN